MNNQTKPHIHGGVIVLSIFLFFPVAIGLILLRVSKHGNNLYLKMLDNILLSRIFLTFSVVYSFLFIGIINNLVKMQGPDESITNLFIIFIILFFLLPGLLFRRKAKKLKKLYEEQINRSQQWVPISAATHNVQVNTNIYNASAPAPPERAANRPSAKTLPPKSVNCTGCGAPVVLKPDEAQPCEYCGTYMTYS